MRKQTWRNFTEAREFVRALKLSSMDGYRKYCKSGKKPKDIPTGPNIAYKKEWISFGDWLGNGVVAYKYNTWRPFEDAKHFAILLKLQSFEEWKKYCKSGNKPDDIPDIPSNIYKNKGWISWPDFLGNKRIVKYTKSNTMPFEECKKFVRSLGVTTGSEWFKWCKKNKRPDNIPYNPDEVYKEWTTWGDFLGPIPEKWKSFEDARKFARSLKLKNPEDWNKFSKLGKRPKDIPSGPRDVYKEDWKGWGDFLGTGNLTSKQLEEQYYPYEDAKKYVQKQKIKTVPKFNKWSSQGKRPLFIPANPQKFYKDWIDWDDFFGREKIVKRSFEDARKFARSLNLQFSSDWLKLHKQGKIPKDIPRYPEDPYEKDWKGWGDFLGTGNLSPSDKRKQMRSYEECKKFVRNLGIKTENQWRDWCKNNSCPIDIPYSFERSYPNEWTTMGDFLGTGFIADKNKVWKSFDEARTIVQKLGLKNMSEYKKKWNVGKIPKDIPADPRVLYKNKGWISSGDWLGTGYIAPSIVSKNYLSFSDAKIEVKKLAKKYNLKTFDDWKKAYKDGKIPKNIPLKPNRVYSKKRKDKK
jgi:hypothetical protein